MWGVFRKIDVAYFLVFPSVFLASTLMLVHYLSCFGLGANPECTFTSISRAANRDPALAVYRLASCIYAITVIPGAMGLFHMWKIKIEKTIQSKWNRLLGVLNQANAVVFAISLCCFVAQALINLRTSIYYHVFWLNTFIKFSAVYVILSCILLIFTKRSETEARRFKWQIRYIVFLALTVAFLFLEYYVVGILGRKNFIFNTRNYVRCEILVTLLANGFLPMLYYDLKDIEMHWYLRGNL